MSKIVLRTHGGLGNQLFQIFFALCCKHEYDIKRIASVHDDNYKHKFQIEERLQQLVDNVTFSEAVLSSLRIPKLLKKFLRLESESINIGTTKILDGYFQAVILYSQFSYKSKSTAMSEIRSALEISDLVMEDTQLEHIRLGDFFSNSLEEEAVARDIITKIPSRCHIITNNEHLVRSICNENKSASRLTVLDTEGMEAIDLLHLMGRYHSVNSNDSTLALWSALLYNRKLSLKNPDLLNFFSTLKLELN